MISTLRGRVLLLVAGVGVLPLALLAVWLTTGTLRAGERLVRTRLDAVLNESEKHIAFAWTEHRYHILFFAENDAVQRELQSPARQDWKPRELNERFTRLPPSIHALAILDANHRVRWGVERAAIGSGRTFEIDEPVHRLADGVELGVVRVSIDAAILLPGQEHTTAGMDAVLAVIHRSSGRPLLPLPFDTARLAAGRFTWGKDEWLAVTRTLSEPPLTLVAAAPMTVFSTPFRQAAKRGAIGLLIIAATGLLVAAMLSRRLTHSLEELADAATAVAAGDLERNVAMQGTAEVSHVAAAFNAMTDDLRRTLAEASQREALAAVGSFASELAHEIRNPLAAMRLDMELVDEQLPPDSPLRALQRNALTEIERLDEVVGGALDLARSGRVTREPMDLAEPLRTALHYAAPRFEQRGGRITLELPDDAVAVSGDQHSLQRLFLNLLLNAADAVPDGGWCRVRLETTSYSACVHVSDNGTGMDAQTLARATDSFFTTKAHGSGLGLAIAQRIAHAHGGSISITSANGDGTTIRVTLPRV